VTAPRLSFRAFLESPHYCGLTLSPAMGAIVDASEGVTPAIPEALSLQLFGCRLSGLPREARRTVAIRAGGRAGKTSRLLAPKAIHAAWTVPLPTVRRGEVARALLTAPDVDLAAQMLAYAKGYVTGSPVLRSCVVESSSKRRSADDEDDDVGTQERIVLRRPHDGHLVEIVVKAAKRGGTTARSRTLVFAGLDEAAFFYADDGYGVTDTAIYDAAIQRVVPGGQVWIASTPWLADEGLLEHFIAEEWGKHEETLVAVAPTRLLNPTWDPDGSIERNMRKRDPDNADREILAIPLAQGAEQLYHRDAIRRALELVPPSRPPDAVGLGADAGFVSDAAAFAVVGRWDTRGEPPLFGLLLGDEQHPERGAPLRPGAVVASWAALSSPWPFVPWALDGHYREALREHADAHGRSLVEAPSSPAGPHLDLAKILGEGRLALGGVPEEVRERLRVQLGAVRRRALPGGGMQVILPRRKGAQGGGHCDLVAALVLAQWQAGLAAYAGEGGSRAIGARRWGEGARRLGERRW